MNVNGDSRRFKTRHNLVPGRRISRLAVSDGFPVLMIADLANIEGFDPGAEDIGQGDQRLEAALGEVLDKAKELTGERIARSFGLMFEIYESAELLLLCVKGFKSGVQMEELLKAKELDTGEPGVWCRFGYFLAQ